jgi:hypothetical protein
MSDVYQPADAVLGRLLTAAGYGQDQRGDQAISLSIADNSLVTEITHAATH